MATQSPSKSDALAQLPPDYAPLLGDYLEKPQLARELRRTVRTVDRLILCEGLPCVRVGNKRLFRRSAVLEWLRSREIPAPPRNKRNGRRAR